MGPSIKLDKVSLSIAGSQILSPLSAELSAGKMHLLVGPNGAGKTSLLKSMLGLTPHQGEIKRAWMNKAQKPAYIPQQPRFDQVLPVTISDFLSAGLSRKPVFFRRQKETQNTVLELLETVGLQGKAELQLGQLSGGERQRLMFAQALSRSSDLWFLDEPMTGLDAEGQALITDLMLNLREQGKTLVVVHHDMGFVREHADNVLLINGGLVDMGPPSEVDLGIVGASFDSSSKRAMEAVA
ncbi:metal ABC transporter ATP-binding protein [Neptuniibacter sp. QD48_11]|uniref:metal ABC transporter ATP-binding protein n=1 Tax=Neptuniibacter sp. QD48_11 TaxID=3398211 RepID=UPI0039F4780F